MPSKLSIIHNLGVFVGFLLALNALAKISAYGLGGATTPFPLLEVIGGLAGVVLAIALELHYRYMVEKQKYSSLTEGELLEQAHYEAKKKK